MKDGDTVEIKREVARDGAWCWKPAQSAERDVPDYIEVDHNEHARRPFVRAPKLADVPYPVQMEPQPRRRVLLALTGELSAPEKAGHLAGFFIRKFTPEQARAPGSAA